VVRQVTHENVTAVELGGPQVHTRQSGSAQLAVAGVDEAFQLVRKVLGYLPSSCWHEPPVIAPTPAWPMPMIPGNPRRAYDVQDVINGIVDAGSACVLHAQFGRNLVTAFARLDGAPVGVVANQPNALGGTLNVTAAEKGARFVRLCDAFGIPLLVLVDTPGFLPGRKEEAAGIIRKGAKLLYAFIEATVPRVTVILRKAYGGAYIVMNSKGIGADAVYAWPTAELGVMGAEGAVEIIHQRRLQRDPASRGDLIREYQQQVMPVERAAARLSVDEIIDPACTRETLSSVLRSLSGGIERTFRHDNQPQ
jgi:propionyl-CoA carboxylase beta chain